MDISRVLLPRGHEDTKKNWQQRAQEMRLSGYQGIENLECRVRGHREPIDKKRIQESEARIQKIKRRHEEI